jgi:hypothetical protein
MLRVALGVRPFEFGLQRVLDGIEALLSAR